MTQLTPYRKVAQAALMSWNKLTGEEALKAVKESSFDKLEGQVDATGSMTTAVKAIGKMLNYSDKKTQALLDATFSKENVEPTKEDLEVFVNVADDFAKIANKEDAIFDILTSIHDGWVADNAKKFNQEGREGRRYQHFPIEMIGWEEATSDLMFVEPILNYLGVKVDKAKLQERYYERVADFLETNGFADENGLDNDKIAEAIMKGSKFYKPFNDEKNLVTDQELALEIAGQMEGKIPQEALDFVKGSQK